MRIVALVYLVIVGCGSPQTTAPSEPIGNANTAVQPSRDAFVEDVMHALSAGDGERLFALADRKGLLDRAVSCDATMRSEMRDEEAIVRRHADQSAANAKSAQMTFVEIDRGKREQGSRHRRSASRSQNARLVMKGEPLDDCTARTEVMVHEVSVKVKVTRRGVPRDSHMRIELLRADGKWFLAEMPQLSGVDSAMAKMEEFRDKMCACKEHDSKCAERVTDEMTVWSQEMARSAGEREFDDVSDDDAKKMSEIVKTMGECSMKAMTPAGP